MPKFGEYIDLQRQELRNAKIQNLASDPGTTTAGLIYFNTGDGSLRYYNGSGWTILGSAGGVAGGDLTGSYPNPTIADNAVTTNKILDGAVSIAKIGTTTFNNQVRSSSLDQMTAPAADVSMASHKLTNLATPTASTDAVTKAYVDGISQGLQYKLSVKVATTANITLSGTQTIDGVAVTAGQRVLVKNQSTPAQNGLYTVASGAWTRTSDGDASGEISVGTYTYVEAGTANGGQFWICTATASTPWVPGTDSSTWVLYFAITTTQAGSGLTASGNVLAVGAGTGISVGADTVGIDTALVPRFKTFTIGDNSSTSFTLTHSLGNQLVAVQVYSAGSPFDQIFPGIERTDSNTVTVRFGAAPTTGQYSAIVVG